MRGLILGVSSFAVICLASGCVSHQSKPPIAVTNGGTISPAAHPPPSALPAKSIYQLDSTWTTDSGQPFKLAALRGRPQVMAMFFTSCKGACPITVSDMKRIETAIPEGIRARVGFALVSFDPARDTVQVLHSYRLRRGLDFSRWTLLRGELAEVAELAARLGMKYKDGAGGQFNHLNIITVLNSDGEIVRQQFGLNQSIEETVAVIQQFSGR